MATKKKKREPLYEQVKNTLNRLQGKCVPSYQGLNAFWMDPEVFLTAELYGRRLIAPKDGEETNAESGCCGSSKPANQKRIQAKTVVVVLLLLLLLLNRIIIQMPMLPSLRLMKHLLIRL